MIKRIIEINNPAYLKIKQSQLVIEQNYQTVAKVPAEDIGILLINHRAIILTATVTNKLIENKAAIIHCDERFMPCAYTLPLDNNLTHSAVLRQQITIKSAIKKRLWQQIVQAKITAQAEVLQSCNKPKAMTLIALAKTVKSGDPENKEAQAAQYYWRELFGETFRRNPDLEGLNSFLNYGYAILRSTIARAVCCAGLHPAIGVHHSNQYNAFCLADDLIEPLRPLVDWTVLNYYQKTQQQELFLDSEAKKQLLEIISAQVILNKRNVPLMVGLHDYMGSFKRVMNAEEKQLNIPRMILEP